MRAIIYNQKKERDLLMLKDKDIAKRHNVRNIEDLNNLGNHQEVHGLST